MVMLSINDNESLMKISGGDIALFEKLTRDFLTSASVIKPVVKEQKDGWPAVVSVKPEVRQAADAEI